MYSCKKKHTEMHSMVTVDTQTQRESLARLLCYCVICKQQKLKVIVIPSDPRVWEYIYQANINYSFLTFYFLLAM